MGSYVNRHSQGEGVQLKEAMDTEGKSPSLFAYLFAPGGNDKQKTNSCNSCKALRSARCLASSQNNVKYVALALEIIEMPALLITTLVTRRCLRATQKAAM